MATDGPQGEKRVPLFDVKKDLRRRLLPVIAVYFLAEFLGIVLILIFADSMIIRKLFMVLITLANLALILWVYFNRIQCEPNQRSRLTFIIIAGIIPLVMLFQILMILRLGN